MINFNFILATTVHVYIVYLAIPCKDYFISLHMFIRILASTCTNTCMDQQHSVRYRSSYCLLIFVLNAHVHAPVQCGFVALSPSVPPLIAGWIGL